MEITSHFCKSTNALNVNVSLSHPYKQSYKNLQTDLHVLFTCPGASNVWPGGEMSACPSLCTAYAFTPLLPLPALLSSSLHPLWALCLLPPLCLLKRTISPHRPSHLTCLSLSLLQIPALSLALPFSLVYCYLSHRAGSQTNGLLVQCRSMK